ncbi:MAG TPA: hypothetical protein VFV52_08750 [Bacilli bacterium]|nr:hypothetical protein [Bacilli bacterium]
MSKITKRALWGYAPESVESTVSARQEKHRQRIAELQQEAATLRERNESLRREIASLEEQQTSPVDQVEAQVSGQLYRTFLQQSKAVLDVTRELAQIEEEDVHVLQQGLEHRKSLVEQVLGKLRHIERQNQTDDQDEEEVGDDA